MRPGIEVLLSDSIHLVRGRRVGLVTNQSGVDARGISDIDRLRNAGIHLVALFSPEHGFRGNADPGASVGSMVDSATGLPIYSLYGRTSSPADSMLAGLDVVLVDLQDAGARYYTYLWTTANVMRAAAKNGKRVIVLDRPNPIGGAVEGNVLDTAYASPVGLLAIPMRHGMTLGELALLARSDLGLGTELTVIPVEGWRRSMYFDETGLPFIPPSPNLRSLESLIHYPGLCLFEGTNLSVGRGSDAPFEQVGATWLDTTLVLAALRTRHVPGVEFSAVTFTPHNPGDGKYADTTVAGIRLRVTDRSVYQPTVAATVLLSVIASSERGFSWIPAQFDRLAGERSGLRDSLAQHHIDYLGPVWSGERQRFLERRRPFLLYPDNPTAARQ
ncbi:MAG: DUF1343 domain-containing protein [Gemmatimonadota bacterium]